MKKSTKLIIEIAVIVVIFAVASVVYNNLQKNAAPASYVPTVSAEKAQTVVAPKTVKVADDSTTTTTESTTVDSSDQSDQDALDAVDDEATNQSQSSNEQLADDESEDEAETSAIMPDIPVVMYPSNEETTFWEVVPKGKPAVLNLFASWCPPCKEEMPGFVAAREKYIDEVTFVFFDSFDGSRETEATLKAFVDKTFTDDTLIVKDPGYMGYIFNSNSIPLTILLNSEGEVVRGFQGAIAQQTLEDELDKLL